MTAVVAPTGVFLTGGLGGDPLEIVAEGAHVETSSADGTLVVEATWDNEDGSGGLRVDCGERHLDVTDLRP